MRTQILMFFFLLLLPFIAAAQKMSEVHIQVSPALQGQIEGRLVLTKGLFNKSFHTIELDNLKAGLNTFILPNPSNIKTVNADFRIISNSNLEDHDSVSAEISGVIQPGKAFKKHELLFNNDKAKADIDCSGVIKSFKIGSVLEIDLSSLKNLSDCGGDDIAEYSPSGVGKRSIDDGANWFTLADDERMGREYSEQFVASNKEKLLPLNHPTTLYMQEKMELIARNSDMPYLKPKVRVINADVLNAFALPGGYVFIFRGLIDKSPSEAGLMGVLGHEWAHVTARHGTRGMTRSLKTLTAAVSVMLIAQVWADVTKDKVKQIILPLIGAGTMIGAQLKLLSKGREQELEADRLGSQYALLSGYHPRGIGDIFEVFKNESPGGSTSIEKMLSSHPDHDSRIKRNHVLSALFYPENTSYVITSNGYLDAVAAMNSEPMPSAKQTELIASAFVNGLQNQQEGIVTKHMEQFITELMKDKKPKEK